MRWHVDSVWELGLSEAMDVYKEMIVQEISTALLTTSALFGAEELAKRLDHIMHTPKTLADEFGEDVAQEVAAVRE